MSQRKLIITAGVLLLLLFGMAIGIKQIAGAGANPEMLLEVVSKLISAVTTITLGYLGANVLDKAQGVVEALRGKKEPTTDE